MWGSLAHTQSAPAHRLRIVGGLAGLSQYTHHEVPFWTRALSSLSGGRYDADIIPFDRAGVPTGDTLRMIQLGVVPFGTVPVRSLSTQYPHYMAQDLAGLNPDMATLKKTVTAFRPYLEHTLRTQHGIEMLALYAYPAQVIFCKKPMGALTDLAGRRIRVASATQADFVSALGGTPLLIAFDQIMNNMASTNTECAITASLSGNTLGLHEVTTHVHAMPVTWGLSIFGANVTAWDNLPPDLKALLRRELPKLEAAIWAESERETAEGMRCNKGVAECKTGRRGRLVEVPASPQDDRRRKEILATTVMVNWLRRCRSECVEVWNQTLGPMHGIMTQLPR